MPVQPAGPYGTISDVTNLARVFLNDSFAGATNTPGEGRIFIDSAPFILPLLNSALSRFQRKLANEGVTTKTSEWFSPLNTPVQPVNSVEGVGVPNPAVQQYLGYNGFFDGLIQWPSPVLPSDLLVPTELWQRPNGTGLTYRHFNQCQNGLSSRFQYQFLGEWDWRGDAIYWNGSLVPMDIRIRYTASVTYYPGTTPVSSFATTMLPFRDSVTALAYLMAEEFAATRTMPGATADLAGKADLAIKEITNRYVRRSQSVIYERGAFGDEDNGGYESGGGGP